MQILVAVTVVMLALVKGLSKYVSTIQERQSSQRPALRLRTSRAAQAALFCDAFLFSAFAGLIGAAGGPVPIMHDLGLLPRYLSIPCNWSQ